MEAEATVLCQGSFYLVQFIGIFKRKSSLNLIRNHLIFLLRSVYVKDCIIRFPIMQSLAFLEQTLLDHDVVSM